MAFEYEGERGPENWGSLSPDYAACVDGSAQSPIDVGGAVSRPLPDVEFDYKRGTAALKNTTHTVQADETEGSSITVDGETYPLVQFHLHEPAEHLVNGVRHDAELHLVHKDAAGRIAVVGVFIDKGAVDTALDPYFTALPGQPGTTAELTGFDPTSLLPTQHRTYRYAGSLTTPPCTEGVSWFVMAEPVQASEEQLTAFRAVIAQNDRPVQPVGDREVVLDSDGA